MAEDVNEQWRSWRVRPQLPIPLYRQLMSLVRQDVALGRLLPGAALPSIRELAQHLKINPSSAVKAFSELKHAGVIVVERGKGTFVSDNPGIREQSAELLTEQSLKEIIEQARQRGMSEAALRKLFEKLLKQQERQQNRAARPSNNRKKDKS